MTYCSIESQSALAALETNVDVLIGCYHTLKYENDALMAHQTLLLQEKTQLLQKTSQARARVEAMINRLKAMEQGL